MVQTDLTKRLSTQYGLNDKDKVTADFIRDVAVTKKIEITDLITILGINKNNISKIKKQIKCKMMINLNPIQIKTKEDIKEAIKMIKIDLKYLKQYGERYYTNEEIIRICGKYDIKYNWFIRYIYSRKKNYYENFEILENSDKGLWIGEKRNIDNNFIKKNYKDIEQACNYISKSISEMYNCNWLKEDIEFEAFIAIIKNGITQKNFEYNNKLMINKLKYNAKFAAWEYVINKFKEISYDEYSENQDRYKQEKNLIDNSFNPEEIIERNSGFLSIKIKDIHKDIMKMIYSKIEAGIEEKNILRLVAHELKMKHKTLNTYIKEIQSIIICYGLVKICENGQVISMSEVDY